MAKNHKIKIPRICMSTKSFKLVKERNFGLVEAYHDIFFNLIIGTYVVNLNIFTSFDLTQDSQLLQFGVQIA